MRRTLSALFLFGATSSLFAQPTEADRRTRDEPELSIEAGGRSSVCDVILYSPDGRRLYAAGDDKVVRIWNVRDGQLDTTRSRTIRWPGWRDQRGGIKTIALPGAAADQRVFVGGFGLKNGTVCVFDGQGTMLGTTDRPGATLPYETVMASTFTPDDKSVIYGAADGTLWHWDLAGNNRQIGQHAKASKARFNFPRLIKFTDADSFVSVADNGDVVRGRQVGGEWKVAPLLSVRKLFATAYQGDENSPWYNDYSVYRADLSTDGKWLACAFQPGFLALVPLDGGAIKLEKVDSFIRSVAFDKDGRLMAAVSSLDQSNNYRIDRDDAIRLYEKPITDEKLAHAATIKHVGRVEAMVRGRDTTLAVAGGDNHEVTLYDIKGKADAPPIQTVKGRGRGLWQVRIGEDKNSFQFRSARDGASTDPNQRGTGDWFAYNFARGRAVEAGKFVEVRNTADGWTIEPHPTEPKIWKAVYSDPAGAPVKYDLPTDTKRDEQPRCYCFIPASKGKPTRVLVGHYYGFSTFELDPKSAPKRTMLGTGHNGDVTSIATDAAGTWAVTSGTDQTIAGWSLADNPNGEFGAKIEIVAGEAVTTEVDLGGPAWEMGLTKGDKLKMVSQRAAWPPQFGLAGSYFKAPYTKELAGPVGTPNDAITVLNNPIPGVEHMLAWTRAGVAAHVESPSTIRRRPLWKFFPGFDENNRMDEWIVWMWRTGHYHCSTNGDRLVGWQLNDPLTISGKEPEFYPADRFRNLLQRKITVLRLMQSRDFAEAYSDLNNKNPARPTFGNNEPPPISLKVGDKAVGPDGLTVDIEVSALGRNLDRLPRRVEVWVNDHRAKSWDAGGKPVKQQVTIPADAFRVGENRVTVLTFTPAGGRGTADAVVMAERSENKPRLLGLMVGINDYSNSSVKNEDGSRSFGDLKAAAKDAESLTASWKLHEGRTRFYSKNDLVVRLGKDADRDAILKALDELVAKATPDDRVVVFLAGHGDFIPKPDAPKGSDERFFVFCGPNYDRAKYKDTGVTAELLFDKLAECKGRKLILLDACHSGEAATENVIRHLTPDGHGPTVMAACDQKEESFEDPTVGNGLFTKAVMEALSDQLAKADKSNDGILDPAELFAYVRGRMPALLTAAGKPARLQNPQSFPIDLARYGIATKAK